MRVFIAGAGYVGLEAAKLLAQQNIDVIIGQRSNRTLPEGVRGTPFTLEDAALTLPEGTTHILFAAAPDASPKGDPANDPMANYERIYVQGMRNILAHQYGVVLGVVHRQRAGAAKAVLVGITLVAVVGRDQQRGKIVGPFPDQAVQVLHAIDIWRLQASPW